MSLRKVYTDQIDEITKGIFNVIGSCHFDDHKEIDNMLSTSRKDPFDALDRYVLVDSEPVYHLPHVPYSLETYNVVRSFQYNDVSLQHCIIITRNPGLIEEFKILTPDNLPKIIDDEYALAFHWPMEVPWCIDDLEFDIDSIEKHALSLFGQTRFHRMMLMDHYLKNNLLDKIATSYNGY